ncbi:MAG: hypothetical protein WBO32_04935 [Cyclobacteriaceae bacterium]
MIKPSSLLYLSLVLLISCNTTQKSAPANNLEIASAFVDAFYSFNSDSLQATLITAEQSQPEILYYQKWAECGHYEVLQRDSYFEKNDSTVIFPVTVKDDLMSALQIDFNVTDTFRISIRDGKIHSVQTSSNDPDEYYEAKEWVRENHPEFIDKACEGIWEGGPTPCECIQGMLKGFRALKEQEATAPSV